MSRIWCEGFEKAAFFTVFLGALFVTGCRRSGEVAIPTVPPESNTPASNVSASNTPASNTPEERNERMHRVLDAARDEFDVVARKTSILGLTSPRTLGSVSSRAQAHRDLAEYRRVAENFYAIYDRVQRHEVRIGT
ncbi:hypothetical protein EON81_26765, partial [bacterium]